jgi:hypothetical protein
LQTVLLVKLAIKGGKEPIRLDANRFEQANGLGAVG